MEKCCQGTHPPGLRYRWKFKFYTTVKWKKLHNLIQHNGPVLGRISHCQLFMNQPIITLTTASNTLSFNWLSNSKTQVSLKENVRCWPICPNYWKTSPCQTSLSSSKMRRSARIRPSSSLEVPSSARCSRRTSSKKVTKTVQVEAIEPSVFKEMLHYLYTVRVCKLDAMTEPLFLAADKYQIEALLFVIHRASTKVGWARHGRAAVPGCRQI